MKFYCQHNQVLMCKEQCVMCFQLDKNTGESITTDNTKQ